MNTKLKKNDQVLIIAGKDKGKKGRILRVDRDSNRLIVEGLNMVKKTQRPKSRNDKGGIVEIEAPFAVSNVQVLCRKCGATRIGITVDDEIKTRICRKCGEAI